VRVGTRMGAQGGARTVHALVPYGACKEHELGRELACVVHELVRVTYTARETP